jgi:hypothetical protein
MQNMTKYIAILLIALLFACSDEDPTVEIDSLSALGDEFFYRQKVKVWMAVKTNDLPAARYTWTCDGGTLTQPQSLDENTWQAPRAPGVYNVTCTVDVNGVKQSRSHEMFVSVFYFDKFERTPHTFTGNNSSVVLVKDALSGTSHLEARVSSTTATRGYVQRAFDDLELHAPFSSQAQVGWISNFPAKEIKIGAITAENTLYYEWTLNRDPDAQDNLFIENIRFEWYPVGKSNGLPKFNTVPWNGTLIYTVRNVTTNTSVPFNVYINHPALTFAQNQNKKVSLSVDASYLVHVFVDGVEVLNSNAIQQWRTTNNSKDDIYINQWRINYVSNTGQTPLIYVDNATAVEDGTILQ